MSDYQPFDFEKVAEALKAVRKQYERGEPIVWTGPENLHFHVAATSPEPAWHFSGEGMDYHAEHDRDFWDVYTMVAFQIGFHNGVVRMEPDVEMARRSADSAYRMLRISGVEVPNA